MGDRCHIRVVVRKSDLPFWEEELAGFTSCEESDGTICEVEQDEVNYGGCDILERATRKGIPFYGSHGSGCDYPEMVFAGDGKRETSIVECDGDPVARVKKDGTINAQDLTGIRRYYSILTRARTMIHGPKRKAKGRRGHGTK